MRENNHYIIGDVHGEYEMLTALVAKLPKDAKLIFVGDLVNRGLKSRQVIAFVREHAFVTIQGNHETYLIESGHRYLENIETFRKDPSQKNWIYLNGTEVLESYGLVSEEIDDEVFLIDNKSMIEKFKEDLAWLASLPISLELGKVKGYDLPVVVTHGSTGDYWHLKDSSPKEFKEIAHSNRIAPSQKAKIFNIYGHVIMPNVTITNYYVAVDTGSGKKFKGAKLSAFCLQTKEVFEVLREERNKK